KRVVQHITPQHRRHDLAAIEAIAIDLAARGPSRVEVRSDLIRLHDANRRWEQRIERALEFAGGKRRLCTKTADLAEGMNSGIGATRAVKDGCILRDAAKDVDNFALDGGPVGLNLP